MTLEEFRRMSEIWGGDIERWPEPKRADAAALARSAEGAAILTRAAAFDRRIASAAPAIDPSRADAAVERAIERLTLPRLTPHRPRPRMTRWLAPAAGLAAASLLGLSLGHLFPMPGAQMPTAGETIMVVLLGGDSLATDLLR